MTEAATVPTTYTVVDRFPELQTDGLEEDRYAVVITGQRARAAGIFRVRALAEALASALNGERAAGEPVAPFLLEERRVCLPRFDGAREVDDRRSVLARLADNLVDGVVVSFHQHGDPCTVGEVDRACRHLLPLGEAEADACRRHAHEATRWHRAEVVAAMRREPAIAELALFRQRNWLDANAQELAGTAADLFSPEELEAFAAGRGDVA